jgi:hypothetical protein
VINQRKQIYLTATLSGMEEDWRHIPSDNNGTQYFMLRCAALF